MNDLLLKLEKLGLSSYEAKALFALMQKHPANGYEISKLAKIPPAKVYETLKRLKNKGVIITDDQVDPIQYYPIPHEKLIHMLKQDYVSTIEALEQELQELQPLPNIDLSWNLLGYQAVITKITQLIEKSTGVLMVSIWPQEFPLVRNAVIEAQKRGVRVIIAIFGNCELEGPYVINLSKCGVTSEKRLHARLTIAVADSDEVVISEMNESEDTVGIWTAIPGIVLVAKEYIKHDIWGNVLIDTLGEAKFKQLYTENEMLSFLIQNR
jgi:HTH-type transcriptional regulator, sugar sensing transcriptional regulator